MSAFERGFRDYLLGKSFYDNPYGLEKPTDETRQWIDGMIKAVIYSRKS